MRWTPVLKTGNGESRSWVRIPPPPPTSLYILPTFWRTGENPREMRHSFSSQRNRESRLTPDSADSASILSVQNRNGSLQRLNALWAAFARPSPLRETGSLILIDRVYFPRNGITSAQLKTIPYLMPRALRRAGHSSGRSIRLSNVSPLSSADRPCGQPSHAGRPFSRWPLLAEFTWICPENSSLDRHGCC